MPQRSALEEIIDGYPEWIVIFVIEVFSANPTAFQLVKCFKCIYVLILLSYLLFFFFNKFKKTDNETFLNGLIVGK